ncbi:MAG TPA: DUF5668 domain-containing protein [Thermoanaerobaculia bacterium]|nr:DUF5668 domain-containing protein [Thermoanaerobaculia bacterium]
MNESKPLAGKLALGLVLLLIGGLKFLDNIDLFNARPLWHWWPLLLIVLGGASELDAIRKRRGDGGIVLLALGVWMLLGTQELFGLTYRTAFPIGIVVVGLGIILHAVIDVPRKQLEENGNHE